MISKCHTCVRFYKTCADEKERCYRGGTDGGLIRLCTGYIQSDKAPNIISEDSYIKLMKARDELRVFE